MRIGIVSDIHCNIAGLDCALAAMGDVDELICAGDAIYQFRFSNEVAARLRERDARIIQGNHEETFFSRDGVRAQAAPWIQADLRDFLSAQPLDLRVQVNGKRLLVVHGSPFDPHREYVYPNSPTLRRCAEIDDAEIVILGHTHYQMAERVGRVLVINPGSAGEPRDPRNDFQLSFAILDTQTDEVQFGNFADPTRAVSASSDIHMTAWQPQGGTTGYGYDQAPKAGHDPWNGSLNV
ncbi:MAG TPA: metallophosphoesterase family protein [Dehalococcoidia bacterium]|nr:metallophosphoesterase family protein [Dehalococcoidia bacterium]